MESSPKLARGARRLYWASLLSLLVVAATILYAAADLAWGVGVGSAIRLGDGGGALHGDQLLTAVVSGVVFALGLWRLARMARRIEAGELFAPATIADMRAFTALVLASALVSILLPPLVAFARALATAPPGARQVTLSFSGGDFFGLLVSAILFLVARLLTEAQRIADDMNQIV